MFTPLITTNQAYRSDIIDAACYAVDVGYRHFDGALFYANEPEVGEAIRHQIEAGKVQRKDLYIVSKVGLVYIFTSMYCLYYYSKPSAVVHVHEPEFG